MTSNEQPRGRWVWGFIVFASLSYLGLTSIIAADEAFWYDELFTFHIARLGDVGQVIAALTQGADIHPPLDYLLRHGSMRLFGRSEFADRLPSIVAFWVACVALYRMVSFRCGRKWGLVAFVAPIVTLAFEYSYEGRAYAPMLAFSMVALAAWQSAVAGVRRRLSLALMGLMAALAVNVHYYGFFIYLPLAVGELWRARTRARLDVPVLLVGIASALGLVANLPFLMTQFGELGTFWTPTSIRLTVESYWWLLNPSVFVIPLLLVLLLLLPRALGPDTTPRTGAVIPGYERAAVFSMLLIPLMCFVLGRAASLPFLYRYMLLTIFGVIVAGCFVGQRYLGRGRIVAALLIAICLAGAYKMASTVRTTVTTESKRERQRQIEGQLPDDGTAVVFGTRGGFMEVTRYGSTAIRQRSYYLVNREASLALLSNDNGQRAMENIAPFVPGHIANYGRFLCDHQRFFLVSPRAASDWLLATMLEDGCRLKYYAVLGNDSIYEVDLDRNSRVCNDGS